MRRELGQQREAARQQAMVAQAQAAQDPINSPLFQQLMMRKPEVAASMINARMQNQAQMADANMRGQLGMAGIAQRDREATLQNALGDRQIAAGETRDKTQADIERDRINAGRAQSIAEIDSRRDIAQQELDAANTRLREQREAGKPLQDAETARAEAETKLAEIKGEAAQQELGMSPQERRFRSFYSGELPMDQMRPQEKPGFNQWLASQPSPQGQGPAPQPAAPKVESVDAANAYVQQNQGLVEAIMGAPMNQVSAGDLADTIYSRHGTPQAVSDGDLASLQEWAKGMDKLDDQFREKPKSKFAASLMDALLGDKPVTSAEIEAIKEKHQAESAARLKEIQQREGQPSVAPRRPPMGGFGAG
jgi:hypothetical protein